MTTDPISDERLAEIRAGLEGVTPGPWRVCETHDGEIIGRPSWPCRRHGVDGEWRVAIADELDGATFEQDANAAHIARLDPQTVAALLSRLDKAEAGWQPIETVPWWDDVLFYDPEYRNDHRKVFEGYCDLDRGLLLSAKGEPVSPTHWRPLPPPPSES